MHTSQEILNASLANARVMVQENMRDSDRWLYRGLLCIFDRQTADEQNSETTKHDNGIGFSGTDAQILSSFAQQVIEFNAGKSKFNHPLSLRQKELCRRKMNKYAMQLVRIARAKRDAELQRAANDAELALVEIESDMGYRG